MQRKVRWIAVLWLGTCLVAGTACKATDEQAAEEEQAVATPKPRLADVESPVPDGSVTLTDQRRRDIRELSAKLQKEPDNAVLFMQRAFAYDYFGEDTKAIADYSAALKLMPELPEAYFNRARHYENIKDYAKSLADYERVVSLGAGQPANSISTYYSQKASTKREEVRKHLGR